MKPSEAPSDPATIEQGRRTATASLDAAIPLAERVAAIRRAAFAKAERAPQTSLTPEERDALWGT